MKWDPETTPNFSLEEMACKCGCGGCEVKQEHMDRMQRIRDRFGPLPVNSGWRCKNHPEEKKKSKPGSHNQGTATDIKIENASDRFRFIKIAIDEGITGLGIYKTFIHIDSGHEHMPRPAIW